MICCSPRHLFVIMCNPYFKYYLNITLYNLRCSITTDIFNKKKNTDRYYP